MLVKVTIEGPLGSESTFLYTGEHRDRPARIDPAHHFTATLSISDRTLPTKPKVATEGFESVEPIWGHLHRLIEARHYSPAIYKDGYRSKENVLAYGDVAIFDVDSGWTFEEAVLALVDDPDRPAVRSLVCTTRSHTPQRHKFRVIVKLDRPPKVSPGDYGEFLRKVWELLGLPDVLDPQCLEAARQYAPSGPGMRYRYITGDEVPVEMVLEAMRREKIAQRPAPLRVRRYSGDSPIERFNADHDIREMLRRYGYKETGNKWLSPHSSTKVPGISILKSDDGRERAYSHHSSDPWDVADSFDLYVWGEFGGDREAALSSIKGSE